MKIKQKFKKAMSFLLSAIMIMMICFGSDFGTLTVYAIDYSIGESDGFSLDSENNVSATFTITEKLGTGTMQGWLLCLFREKPSVDASTGKLKNSGSIHPYSYSNCAYYFFSPDTENATGTHTALWSGTASDEKGSGKTLGEVIKEEDWHIVIGPRYYYTGWGASGIGEGTDGIWENGDYYVGQASEKVGGYNEPQKTTLTITLDRTNYAEGYVELYTYDSEGNDVADTQENNAAIAMPEGGSVKVFADSEFTVEAEGASVSEVRFRDGAYQCDITNITESITIVVSKAQSEQPEEPEQPTGVIADLSSWITVNGNEIIITPPESVGYRIWDDHRYTVEQFNSIKGTNIGDTNNRIAWMRAELYDDGNDATGTRKYDFDCQIQIVTIDTSVVQEINGTRYYAITGIHALEPPAHTHTWSTDWSKNEEKHWKECSCGEKNEEATHTDANADNKCDICGYEKEVVVTAPVITKQPQNVSVKVDEKATFSVTATGDNLKYQWQINRNDGNGFVNISSATSASYVTSAVDMSCNGFKYQCIVSNEGGNVTSNSATLTVTEKEVVHTHSLTLVPEKAATCAAPGNKAYYTCSGCDNLFADANGTTTTTAEAVKIAALGHDWSGEWTIIKEATDTKEGKQETYCVRDCGQKKVAIIPVTGTTDDNGNLEKDAEVEAEAPIDEATLNNSKEELLEAGNIFIGAEKTQIADGADARVWLEIGKTNESAIASTDEAKIKQEATKIMGDNLSITYFDADLFKKVGTNKKTPVPEPGIKIKITITIPDELLNSDKTVSREYKIIRLHYGQVDVLNGTFDATTGEFTFASDKFSTYAIVYKDVPVNENNNPTPEDDEDDSTSEDNDVVKTEDKLDEVPDTGDSNITLYSFVLMLLSGLGIIICSRNKKIFNKES